MVRVFSVYQFGGQTVHRISDDIRGACLIDSQHIVLAKCNHLIEIIELKQPESFSIDTNEQQIANDPSNLNENEIKSKFVFPTVDEVIEMDYCTFGNYIATIEQKSTITANPNVKKQRFCRIYTNWLSLKQQTEQQNAQGNRSTNELCYNIPMRARIAGKVTPSTNNTNYLEVIEIPVNVYMESHCSNSTNYESDKCDSNLSSISDDSSKQTNTNDYYPHKIATCNRTGTLICAVHRTIKLFKCSERSNDGSHFKFIDFNESPFEIDLDFVPIYLSINECIIGCGNREFVSVFKLIERSYCNEAESDGALPSNSLMSSSELSDMSMFNHQNGAINDMHLGCGPDESKARHENSSVLDYRNLTKKSLQIIEHKISSTLDMNNNTNRKQSTQKNQMDVRPVYIENAKPLASIHHIVSTYFNTNEIDIKPLIQARQHDLMTDPFQCISIKPLYVHCDSVKNSNKFSSNQKSLFKQETKTPDGQHLIGIAILIATVNDGYMYQFTNNDKWTSTNDDLLNHSLIAIYPFTSPIIDVRITNYVIHALTEHGIETYTHRIGHKLFSNPYEYGLQDDPFHIEATPRIEEPICLIGLRPFLGVKQMVSTEENLILFANNNEDVNDGSSQNVPRNDRNKNKTQTDLSTSNWTTYNLKLPSACSLYSDFLELARNYLNDSPKSYSNLLTEAHIILRLAKILCDNTPKPTVMNVEEISRKKEIEKLYLDSCLLLGDISVISSIPEEYSLAFAYYTMGEISLKEVYDRIVAMEETANKSEPKCGAVYTLKALLAKSSEDFEEIGKQLTAVDANKKTQIQTLGEKILDFFGMHAPNELASIALNSHVFREYMSAKICEIILQIKGEYTLSSEEKLCLILDLIRIRQSSRVLEILNTFGETNLYGLLIKYWNVLFDITKTKKSEKNVLFSEFTESYLIPAAATKDTIQICMIAVLKYLSIDTNLLNIEVILKLFINYLASQVGNKLSYKSAQSILEGILEAYLHKTCHTASQTNSFSNTSVDEINDSHINSRCKRVTTINSEENHSLLTNGSSGDLKLSNGTHNLSETDCSLPESTQDTRKVETKSIDFDKTQSDQMKLLSFKGSIHNESLKILIRIYLSSIRDRSLLAQTNSTYTINPIRGKYIKFLYENFPKVYSNHISYLQETYKDDQIMHTKINKAFNDTLLYSKTNEFIDEEISSQYDENVELYNSPILFLQCRPEYLSAMEPIKHYENTKRNTNTNTKILDYNEKDLASEIAEKAMITVLKLQSLLSSGRLSRDILQEVVYFIEADSMFIGLDSFLTILLPFDVCIDYLLNICPDVLLNFAKCRAGSENQKWQRILLRITMQRKSIVQNRSLDFYECLLKDHLNYLIHGKKLSEILNIFPMRYINDTTITDVNVHMDLLQGSIADTSTVETTEDGFQTIVTLTYDDYAIFTHYLKIAIDYDRSERLGEMIKTTGYQLYSTFIGRHVGIEGAANECNGEELGVSKK